MKTLKQIISPNNRMEYTIYLCVRGRGLQLLKLTENEKNRLLNEKDLDSVYKDWVEKKEYNFEYDGQFLTPSVDRYSLKVEDVSGNIVYESDNVNDLISNDRTFTDREQDKFINGYDFAGVDDGYYLVHYQTVKGCYYTCTLEIDGGFDANRLYVIRDRYINDELVGDNVFPFKNIFYQKGDTTNLSLDNMGLEFDSDCGDQYVSTYLFEVKDKDWWINLKEG